jgi:hypothetical protein
LDAPELTPDFTRIDGSEGVAIVAGDGRPWHFAGPAIRYRPRFVTDASGPLVARRIELEATWGLPLEVSRPLRAASEAARAQDDEALIAACFSMAVPMLRSCHQLDDAHLADVLSFGADDIDRFCSAIINVASGRPADFGSEPGPDLGDDPPRDDPFEPIPLAGDDQPARTEATEPANASD